jgi:hypothetical protein
MSASKVDDALAAALAQNKALTLTNEALTKALAANAANNSSANRQRAGAANTASVNEVAAQQAVSDQKETSVRVETKTDAAIATAAAAKTAADSAATAGDRNTNLIYMWGALGIIVPSFLKFLSDGRMLRWQETIASLAAEHQADVLGKLNKAAEDTAVLKTQTNGMSNKLQELAMSAGHSQGMLDAQSDSVRTGDR